MSQRKRFVAIATLGMMFALMAGFSAPVDAAPVMQGEIASELEVLQGQLNNLYVELQELQVQLVAAQNSAPKLAGQLDAKAYAKQLNGHRAAVDEIIKRINQIVAEIQKIETRMAQIRNSGDFQSILPVETETRKTLDKVLTAALERQLESVDAQIPVPPTGGKPVASRDVALSDSQKVKTSEISKNFGQAAKKEAAQSQGSSTPSETFEQKAHQALSDYARIIAVPRPGEKEVRDLINMVNQLNHKKLNAYTAKIKKITKLQNQLMQSLNNLKIAADLLSKGKSTGTVTWISINTDALKAKKNTTEFTTMKQLMGVVKQHQAQLDQLSKMRNKQVNQLSSKTNQLNSTNQALAKVMHSMLTSGAKQ